MGCSIFQAEKTSNFLVLAEAVLTKTVLLSVIVRNQTYLEPSRIQLFKSPSSLKMIFFVRIIDIGENYIDDIADL